VTDRLIRITTALAVVAVAVIAAIISYQRAYELVRPHGESRRDGPIASIHSGWADLGRVHSGAGRQPPGQPVPRLGAWSLGAGIVATVGANLAHGAGHGPVGARRALALVGAFELLMMPIRTGHDSRLNQAGTHTQAQAGTR
jgi:hypothetical protein